MAEGGGSTQIWVAAIGAVAAIATALIAAGIMNGGRDKSEVTPTPTPTPVASPARAEPAPEVPANLEGDWVALNNQTHITQDKSAINMDAILSVPGFPPVRYSAKGVVTGHSLAWDFHSEKGDAGHCTATIEHSDDLIQGGCDHVGGAHSDIVLTRVP